jgi:hypothetical protein
MLNKMKEVIGRSHHPKTMPKITLVLLGQLLQLIGEHQGRLRRRLSRQFLLLRRLNVKVLLSSILLALMRSSATPVARGRLIPRSSNALLLRPSRPKVRTTSQLSMPVDNQTVREKILMTISGMP